MKVKTPLHWQKQNAVAELLLSKGAIVNSKDSEMAETQLHIVSQTGRKEVMKILVSKEGL
jgi:ankyrin repeat protein